MLSRIFNFLLPLVVTIFCGRLGNEVIAGYGLAYSVSILCAPHKHTSYMFSWLFLKRWNQFSTPAHLHCYTFKYAFCLFRSLASQPYALVTVLDWRVILSCLRFGKNGPHQHSLLPLWLVTDIPGFVMQTFGGQNLKRVGVILQRGILILFLFCIPCWGFLINSEAILLCMSQDREVAR